MKAVQLSKSGGRLVLEGSGYAVLDRSQMNVDPIAATAAAIRECTRSLQLSQSVVVGALPGQSVVIRYPRLPEMPEARLGEPIEKEAAQHIPYDLAEVFLDWSLLDAVSQGNEKLLKVLLVAVKHETIDARVQVAEAADLPFHVLGVDSLALADAAEACDFLRVGETVALVNVGLSGVSIHFVKDGISNFIRDVSWGAKELVQALVRARRLDYEQAERVLCEASVQEEAPPPPEEVENPAADAGRGASLLEPFEDELEPAAPVRKSAPTDTEKSVSDILATPLNRLVSEIRRSFEYYEHELYESAVDRLVLSGGVAHLPLLQRTLSEELGVKNVEVANPMLSALEIVEGRLAAGMSEHPAQFMVAVGLAARGTAEL